MILLLPYEHLVQLYMHLIAASLLILQDIISRVYVEEEVAIQSASKSQILGSESYNRRQFYQIGNVQLLLNGCLFCPLGGVSKLFDLYNTLICFAYFSRNLRFEFFLLNCAFFRYFYALISYTK